MKKTNERHFDESVIYSREHTWIRQEGDLNVVGISDFAQEQLGEIIFVELPLTGDVFDKDQRFGVIESAKSVSELIIPVGGEIIEVNSELENSPELVNSDPFATGWMIKIKPVDIAELDDLLSASEYRELVLERKLPF